MIKLELVGKGYQRAIDDYFICAVGANILRPHAMELHRSTWLDTVRVTLLTPDLIGMLVAVSGCHFVANRVVMFVGKDLLNREI